MMIPHLKNSFSTKVNQSKFGSDFDPKNYVISQLNNR